MNFSRLIFPAPNPPTYSQDRLIGELLYVPKDFSDCPYKYMKDRHSSKIKLKKSIGYISTPRSLPGSQPKIISASALFAKKVTEKEEGSSKN